MIFVHTSDPECATSFGASVPGITFFRNKDDFFNPKFDEKVNHYLGSPNATELDQFVVPKWIPTVITFDKDAMEDALNPIFGA